METLLLISFFVSIILGWKTIDILKKRKVKQTVREEGLKSHYVKTGTPTMGGIFVIFTVLIVGLIQVTTGFLNLNNTKYYLAILISTILFGLIGFVDDYLKVEKNNTDGLSPKKKMISLFLVAIIFSILSVTVMEIVPKLYIPFAGSQDISYLIFIPLIVIVLLSTTNAINLTDGVDGLATVVGIAIMIFLLVVSILQANIEVTSFLLTSIGAFIGFLLYNWYKAKVFMGDVGSFFLGAVIGVTSIALNVPLYLLIVAVIPIIETLSVILQVGYYKKTKKRLFKMAPIHHHFEKEGWSEVKIVIVFGIISLLGTLIAVLAYIN